MRGLVSYEGRGQAGCEVRLCDLAAGQVVAVTSSDAAGGFGFEPAPPPSTLLVARCADEAIGLAGAQPEPGADEIELALESAGEVHPVSVAVRSAGSESPPPDLTLALQALTLAQAPDVWLAAARIPAAGVTRRWFAAPSIATAEPSVLRIQAGRWSVHGQHIAVVTAHAPGLEPRSWAVAEALVDGRPATLTEGGFELDLAAPVQIELVIAPAP
jgi:hypothetical protein